MKLTLSRLQLTALPMLAILSAASLTACIDGANPQDIAVQNMYGGCWPDLFNWVWQAYQLTDDSWNPAGLSDACNINLPFVKVVNAAYVINYTLSDNYSLQWHSTEDYRSSSRAGDNRFHGDFYIRFIQDGGGADASAETGRFLAEDRTNLHCPLFSLNDASDDPVNRASVLVHESWHHWQLKHGFKTEHINGPTPACTGQGPSCDYFYPHGIAAFDFGKLDSYNTDPNHLLFHSPYQVQAEFDGDVAELAIPSVPMAVTEKARYYGNNLLANSFVNRVAYRIGDPRPW